VISVVNANYLKLGNIRVLVAIGLRPSEKIFLSMWIEQLERNSSILTCLGISQFCFFF